MSNEKEKIAKFKIKPQSPCKRFKGKKLGKDEYWSPNLVMSKKIETMDMETGFLKKNFKIVNRKFPTFYPTFPS